MDAPSGKGLYTRSYRSYPDGDVAGYARRMGCQFVVFNQGNGDDHIRKAQDMGMGTYLYDTPEGWLPNTWQKTLYGQFERVVALKMDGFVADVEDYDPPRSGQRWKGHDSEVDNLITTLAGAAQSTSVGFTSFPSWPWYGDMARAGLWGSPQVYGIASPGNINELHRRLGTWKALFPQVVPSLAGWQFCNKGCKRTLAEEWEYLSSFNAERGGILWTSSTPPLPGTDRFQLLAEWNVTDPFMYYEPGDTYLSVAARHFMRPLCSLRRA